MAKLKNIDFKFKLILFLLTLILSSHFSRLGVDIHHQGIMVNGAMGLLSENGIIYKEYYYHYGPLTAVLHALVFLFFGFKLINIQIFTCIVYAIVSVLLYKFGRLILNSYNAFFSVLIWVSFAPYMVIEMHPWSSVYLLPFFILINILLFKKQKKRIDFFYLGLFVGIIFFIRQSCGLISVFGLVCLIPIYRPSNLIYSLIGLATIFLIVLTSLWSFGILNYYIDCSFSKQVTMIYNPADTVFDRISYIFSILFKNLTTDNWFPLLKPHRIPYIKLVYNTFLFFFVIYCSVKICVRWFRDGLSNNLRIFLSVFIFSLVNLSQLYPVHCLRHSYWSFTPIFPLIFLFVKEFLKLVYTFSKSFSKALKFGIILLLSIYILLRIEIGVRRTIDISKDFSLLDVNRFPLLEGMYVTKDFIPFGNELLKKRNKIREIVYFNHFQFEPYLLPFLISKPPIKYIKSNEIDMREVDSLQNNYRHSTIFFPKNSVMYYMKNKN